ncbi:MAG: hypothetical protein ACR2N3_12665 [Pyrinomonadaceae bacterium]
MADLALEYLESLYALEPGEKPKSLLKDTSIESNRQVLHKNLLPDKISRSKSGDGSRDKKCCRRCGALVLAHAKFCGRCGKFMKLNGQIQMIYQRLNISEKPAGKLKAVCNG